VLLDIRQGYTSKSKNLLFAGSIGKKGQAKLVLFWCKGNETPLASSESIRQKVKIYFLGERQRNPTAGRVCTLRGVLRWVYMV
jgi:hypothetical protein